LGWNDRRVLVTGGCGFIGVNLVRTLVAQGARVRVVDDLSTGDLTSLADVRGAVEFVEGDVRDRETMRAVCAGQEVVFHLAAQPGVIPSVEDPRRDYEVNAAGTFETLLAAKEAGVSSFVYASSNAAVGEFTPGADESQPPRPLSPYGASKLTGEAYCAAFAASYGLRTASLRFANAYGPYSTHKQSVIARFIRRILADEPLTVFGDGTQIRDFIHVDDLCRALLLATDRSPPGEVFHIASGRPTTVLELVQLFKEVVGRELPVVFEPPREGEAFCIAPSVEKAKRVLGFEASVALRDGLAATYAWFRERAQSGVVPP
jgi:UDP-glucose 4-epimerase